MHLTKLEIFGFKSFANKTVVNFNREITGIVGPNGCGKTNIVDAIRWVLGEQKSSTLRSDKMENVIFNGTKNRKPMGMSEVSLTLENDRGVLPTEYSEVTITRRIFRSGESEYLLNKNVCRLKDITNLFMDTGMGTNAYSVIELKMIETILSNKADERRKMFEEAAGVNKYKLRRRLSLKKLDEVKSDLTRVNDIISEVEKTVRSLERQAKKADKYNQIQSILREKELDLSDREFYLYNSQKIDLSSRVDELKIKRGETDSNIRNIENQLIELREDVSGKEYELRTKQREISQKKEEIFSIQKGLSVSEERTKSLSSNAERFKREIEEFEYQIIEADNFVDENEVKIIDFRNLIIEKEETLSKLAGNVEEKKSALENKRLELKEINDGAINLYKTINNLENEINSKKDRHSSINKEIENANNQIQNITNKLAKTVGYLEDLSKEQDETKRKLEESEALYTAKQTEKENLEKELAGLKEKELEAKAVVNGLKDKIDFIQTLITNLEGVSKGSKVLLEDKSWSSKSHSIFADVGNSKEEYRYAMEIALQSVLNNLLIEEIVDLQQAVSYLKDNDLGKASFIILKNTDIKKSFAEKLYAFSAKRKKKKISKEKGFLSWAEDLIESDEKWKPYFSNVLANTAVVDTLENAIQLYKNYSNFNFATVDGDLVQPGGIITAGSLPKLDDSIFGRKKLLEELKNEIPAKDDELKNIQNQISEKEEILASIDLKILSEQGRIIFNDLSNIEKQISQFEFEQNKANEEIDKTRNKTNELFGQSNDLDNQIKELEQKFESQNFKRNETDEIIESIESSLTEIENEYNQIVSQRNQINIELERKRGELKNIEAEIARAKQSKDNISNSIEKKKRDIVETNEQIETIKIDIEDNQVYLDELEFDKKKLEESAKEYEEKLNELKRISSQYEKELNQFRNERQHISDELHNIDLKLSDINHSLSVLVEHVKEEYSIELEMKQFDDLEEFNFKETRAEVRELKSKIKDLGPINLLAYSEYEEEKERFDFLNKQREDLIESEKDLINTIKEINESAQTLFTETYEQIRSNFKRIFQTLFDPGDEADLVIEDNVDPLEAKIEIIAKPKGKRPTGIEMLSGGEKTLTATALLFAIYLVKPSPFCILDEVDAPLDDANVDRFTRLLEEFQINTQFIIVTHNKQTMTAARNMYGVTIQEEGVSKLVGVKFEDIMDNKN